MKKISIILIFNISLCCNAQVKNDFLIFKEEVGNIYKKMAFNDFYLNITKVKIKNISTGIAFAYFDPKTKERSVFLNYVFIYNNIWKNLKFQSTKYQSNSIKLDSFNVKRSDLIKIIIAHEWAHHFLSHTFGKASIENEREADILAGRVLAQDDSLKKNKNNSDIVNNLLKSLGLIIGKYVDVQHLSFGSRNFLLNKGFFAETISNEDCSENNLNSFINKNKNLIINQLQAINYEPFLSQKIKPIETDLTVFKIKLKITQDTIAKLNKLIKNINSDTTKVISDTIKTKIEILKHDTLTFKKEIEIKIKNIKKTSDSLKKVLNDKIKSFDLSQIFNHLDSINKETYNFILTVLYDKLYLDLCNNKNNIKLQQEIVKLWNIETAPSNLVYNLVSDFQISIDLKNNFVFVNNAKFKLCDFNIKATSGSECLLKEIDDSDKEKFSYYFQSKEGLYYIDKNLHLWSEIIAAKSLHDKIFLQHYLIPPKK